MMGITEWIAVEILGFNCIVTSIQQQLSCCGGIEFTITVNTKTHVFYTSEHPARPYTTL
jgi:hypothetical protein